MTMISLINKNGEKHSFKNSSEILEFTENVGMYALYEMFTENQVDFLILNGKA